MSSLSTAEKEKTDGAIIERTKEKLAYENKWLKVYFDEVKFPNGNNGNYNRIVESGLDGTVVLPLSEDGKIGILRQYRYPIGQSVWEVPRGFGEYSLTSLENAKKELAEEMNLRTNSDNWVHLGSAFSNTGLCATRVQYFLARNVVKVDKSDHEYKYVKARDENEIIEKTKFVTYQELTSLITDGVSPDSFTIVALQLATIKLPKLFSK
ncbi:ADP-ribose pyrophosphatase [Reticulomyxa filosa]|uniref:ADP-ribose pyrophosphatase n=1 Tax=Reticulomyxa filosa TaxID=46433 RepID=X6NCC9_RETFI|nr:ADP-ribose pyrophosphatase [Reticulomyxa filosa]|eukprot:ETO22972.1 ADP-ribose pyrophosphatase [Reticulomyxa filosa]